MSDMTALDNRQPMSLATIDAGLAEQWARIRGRLRRDVGEAAYRSWLKPLTLAGRMGSDIQIAVPTRFIRDWVLSHYADRIRDLWRLEDPSVKSLEILVEAHRAPSPHASSSQPAMGGDAKPDNQEKDDRALSAPSVMAASDGPTGATTGLDGDGWAAMGAALDPRFTFENFVTGKSNELAYAAAYRVADSTGVSFNPLFLYGGVGLGKTHLMHAIAWHIRARTPKRRVIYLSAEKFMYQFIRALKQKSTVEFKEQFRSVDVLMIDDVQFISGKESTQEEFFHTFNALVDQNRQVIISADKSPSDLEGLEERMRSRLGWGLVADIHPTTYELRLGILQSKMEQLRAAVPHKVLEFLAHKITSNIRELEGALNRIVAHATLIGRPITLESVHDVLQDLIRASDRRVTIEEIQRRVAEHYNVKIADMMSARRARQVARPRQVAMYLAKHLTTRSLPEIGRKFGGRDHTTVMHAVKKIEELCAADHGFSEDVTLLRRMLQN